MHQSIGGNTFASTRLRTTVHAGPVAAGGNGATTTILNWTSAGNDLAAWGTVVVFENSGPDPIDVAIVEGSWDSGGSVPTVTSDGPIAAGEPMYVPMAGAGAAAPFVRARVQINGANGAMVSVRVVVRDF
jgi:hypothetical protein